MHNDYNYPRAHDDIMEATQGRAWKQLFGGFFSPLVVLTVNIIHAEAEEQCKLNYAYISDKKAAYEIANDKST